MIKIKVQIKNFLNFLFFIKSRGIPEISEIPIPIPKVPIPSNPDPEIFWNPDPVQHYVQVK
jgi:hypothetical protein